MTSYLIRQAVKGARRAYKQDRANRYRIDVVSPAPRLQQAVPDYHGTAIWFVVRVPIVKQGYISDGATMAPDKIGSWSFIQAVILHDAIYEELEAIAAAWGWSVAAVRKLADDMFLHIACRHAPTRVARIYYRAVRLAGGIGHDIMQAAAAITIITLLAAGCSGCSTPPNPFEDLQRDYVEPEYTKIAALPPPRDCLASARA